MGASGDGLAARQALALLDEMRGKGLEEGSVAVEDAARWVHVMWADLFRCNFISCELIKINKYEYKRASPARVMPLLKNR